MITRIYIAAILLMPVILLAQQPQDRQLADQYRMDQEQRQRAALMQTMDSAVVMMEKGEYAGAELRFIYVLNNIKSVPSDLTFYFGKNSHYLAKHKQSVDWLSKYIQLKGTNGQHYDEAVTMLKQSEAEVLKSRASDAAKAEQVLSRSYDIDCGPSGKVICPVCDGSTVIIKKSAFGSEYKTCGFCDTHGQLTCDQYNKLLRGELEPRG